MEMNIDQKTEWLKKLVAAYEQEQKEADQKSRDEAEIQELKRKEREKRFNEIYSKNVYPILSSYHVKLISVYKELNLFSDDTEKDPTESELNELKIHDSYIRFNLNEDEYLPPIEVEVCIRGDIPKAEWLQFKHVTREFVQERCEDFIMNVFQVAA